MDWLILGLAVATFFSTLIGGTLAIKFKRALPYFFAFAAGSLIAVTFFDLLPESLELASNVSLSTRYIMVAVVASFVFYSVLEKYFLIHHHDEEEGHGHIMGPIGAGSLVVHSFLDGAAIGASYRVNPAIGRRVHFKNVGARARVKTAHGDVANLAAADPDRAGDRVAGMLEDRGSRRIENQERETYFYRGRRREDLSGKRDIFG